MNRLALFALLSIVVFAGSWQAYAADAPAKAGAANPVNTLSDAEKAAGWRLLFDGQSTAGWHAYGKKDAGGWVAKDGTLLLDKPGAGDLTTDEQYGDFELTLEWKFVSGNNSGVIYRAAEIPKQPSYMTGPEMQVMPAKPGAKLGKNDCGSLYDVYAPSENPAKEGQDWVAFKLVCKGKHIEHWVDGVKVVDCDIGSPDWNERLAKSKWSKAKDWATLPKGHLCLQDHGAKVMFRNVKIRTLDAK